MTAAQCCGDTVLPCLLPDFGGDISSDAVFHLADWQASLTLLADDGETAAFHALLIGVGFGIMFVLRVI